MEPQFRSCFSLLYIIFMKTPAQTNTSISYNVKNYIKIYLKTKDDVWDLYLMKTII